MTEKWIKDEFCYQEEHQILSSPVDKGVIGLTSVI